MSEQSIYIAREAQALHEAIIRGDREDATATAVTLRQELTELLQSLDPNGVVVPRIARSNGTYMYPTR